MTGRCQMCNAPFDDAIHRDCGGDCLLCMARYGGDPDAALDVIPHLIKQQTETSAELVTTQHELANLHNAYRLYPGAWCCRTAQASNGWHHATSCRKYVLPY